MTGIESICLRRIISSATDSGTCPAYSEAHLGMVQQNLVGYRGSLTQYMATELNQCSSVEWAKYGL